MGLVKTLIVCMLLLTYQVTYGINVGGRTVTIDDWDSMSSKDRQSALNIYNNLNGTSLTGRNYVTKFCSNQTKLIKSKSTMLLTIPPQQILTQTPQRSALS